jgi:prepilin-type processing-associated H-X9-DG protein
MNPGGPTAKASLTSSAEIHVWYHIVQPGFVSDSTGATTGIWDDTWGVARDIHSDGSEYAFGDGHVKWERIVQTVGPRDPTTTAWTVDKTSGAYIGNQWMLNNSAE